MQIKYFACEHGLDTVSAMNSPRYDTYYEAEQEALKTKVINPSTTMRIYEVTTKEVAAVVSRVERHVTVYDKPR